MGLPPARRFAILTCMDARLDPAKYAGLSEGDAHVIRNAGGRASDDAIIQDPFGPGDAQLYESDDHHANWFRCIKTRERPICDVEIGHRSATVCHLGNIAIRSGRRLVWDPRSEQITNDTDANRWLSRPMRAPWHL